MLRENDLKTGFIPLMALPQNQWEELDLTLEQEFMSELLKEASHEDSWETLASATSQGKVSFKGKILRDKEQELGDYCLVQGNLNILFYAQCVNSLEEMTEELDIEIMAAFIDSRLEQDERYQEEVEIPLKGQVWELFFLDGNKLSLKDLLLEYVILNRDPFPKLHPFKGEHLN